MRPTTDGQSSSELSDREPERHIAKSALLLAVLGMVTVLFTMGWHLSVAALYGTSGGLDAFWIGLALPKAIADSLHFGILTFVFVFVFHAAGPDDRSALISAFFTKVFLLSVALAAGLFLFAPSLTAWMAPGFNPEQKLAAAASLRWLSLMLLPSSIAGGVAGVLNAQRRFTPFALARLAAPIAQIGALYWLTPRVPSDRVSPDALVWAVLIGASAMLVVCAPWLSKIELAPGGRFRGPAAAAATNVFFALAGFALLERLNQMSDRFFASLLAEGSLSILEFAWRFEVPVAHILSFSVALPSFVLMAAHASGERVREVGRIALASCRLVALLVVPVVGFLVATRKPLVGLWFLHGRFPETAVADVASLLPVLAVIFVMRSFGSIMVLGFLALGSLRHVLLVLTLEILANTALNAVLAPRYQLVGIVAATAIAMTLANLYLWSRFVIAVDWSWLELIGRSGRAFAATLTSLIALNVLVWFSSTLTVDSVMTRAFYLVSLGLLFVAVHTLSAKAWGELDTILGRRGGGDGASSG